MIVLDQQIHAALDRTVWAVCGHNFVYYAIRSPAAVRRIMQMRSVGFDDLFEILYLAHKLISHR